MLTRCLAFFFLFCSTWSAAQVPLNQFGGATPVIGPFNEKMPTAFFSQDFQQEFDDHLNYSVKFIPPPIDDIHLVGYFTNDTDVPIDILLTGVDRVGNSHNHLFQVAALDYLEIDISELSGYNSVMVMSLANFGLSFNVNVFQDGVSTMNPVVSPPVAAAVPEIQNYNCHGYRAIVRIANNPPSTPGSHLALAIMSESYNPANTQELQIQYPIGSHRKFHWSFSPQPTCGLNGVFYTKSTSQRQLFWEGMVTFISQNRTPQATCIWAKPGDSCFVPGTSTRATWSVSLVWLLNSY